MLLIDKLCEFCAKVEPEESEIPRVRRPFPDQNREGLHYCSLDDTPREGREVDDYQPRVVFRKLFGDDAILKCFHDIN